MSYSILHYIFKMGNFEISTHVCLSVFTTFSLLFLLIDSSNGGCLDPSIKYDYIIVGAGASGAVVAARLSEDPKQQVLLLEAGDVPLPDSKIPLKVYKLMGTEMDWNYLSTPQEHCCGTFSENRIPFTRGKCLGGTTSINVMYYQWPNKEDMNYWYALGNKGWSYKSVLPYLQKIEDYQVPVGDEDAKYHSQGGPLSVVELSFKSDIAHAFIKAGEELGYSKNNYNSKKVSGFSYNQFSIKNGSRASTYTSYLLPAMKRKNLKVVTKALVTQILLDDNKRAVGVKYEVNSEVCTVEASKEIIVSGGAINSPQLLMLSGIGAKEELEKHNIPVKVHLPGVGKNFHDHAVVGGQSFYVNESVTINPAVYETEQYEEEWKTSGTGPLTVPLTCETIALFNTKHNDRSDDDWVDGEITMCSTTVVRVPEPHMKMIYSLGLPPYESEMVVFVPFHLRPKSRGTISLNSNDPHDPPLINPNYLSNPDDIDALIEVLKMVTNITETKAFQKYGASKIFRGFVPQCFWYSIGSDDHHRCVIESMTGTGFHPVGSCKMGVSSDPLAVVDERLRVYGVKGLRVADASIMPAIVAGHPAATCIMIGEKVADMIKEDQADYGDSNSHCTSDQCN